MRCICLDNPCKKKNHYNHSLRILFRLCIRNKLRKCNLFHSRVCRKFLIDVCTLLVHCSNLILRGCSNLLLNLKFVNSMKPCRSSWMFARVRRNCFRMLGRSSRPLSNCKEFRRLSSSCCCNWPRKRRSGQVQFFSSVYKTYLSSLVCRLVEPFFRLKLEVAATRL